VIGDGGIQPTGSNQQTEEPMDIAFDSEGDIIIADIGKQRIQKFYQDDKLTTLYTSKDMMVSNLFVDQYDNIYFTDHNDNTVKKLTKSGTMAIVAGTQGQGGSQLNQLDAPNGIYVDRQGALFIADGDNNRVMKYLANNQGILVVGGGNELNAPTGIYVDEDGDGALYVSDTMNHRIQKYLPGALNGTTVAGGRQQGKALNQLYMPFSLFVDSKTGNVFVVDTGNNRLVKWSKGAQQGEVLSGTTHLNFAISMRFDSEWNLYVVEQGKKRVVVFPFNSASCKN
jgi:sugar lactone lactonase YvrE